MSEVKPKRVRKLATPKDAPKAKLAPGTKTGRPRIKFDDSDSERVRLLARVGTRRDIIATVLGCSADTLARRFPDELNEGMDHANALVAGTLFKKALTGDATSMIWWEKTRAGMKEISRTELTGPEGAPIATETTVNLAALPLDDLRALETILGKLGSADTAPAASPAA